MKLARGAWLAALALTILGCGLGPDPAAAAANPGLAAFTRGIDPGPEAPPKAGKPDLHIARLQISVNVVGRLADVTIEATLANTGKDTDEARFRFELPSDAVVTGYALDIGGKLIPGALLDQPKARNVYEDEVRKGIDPGLAEVKAENLFETRVYPIGPGQSRTIRLSYSAPLPADGTAIVPLALADAVDAVGVDVSVGGYQTMPTIVFAGRTLTPTRRAGVATASWSGQQAGLETGLTVQGGTPLAGALMTHHRKGGDFFQIAGTLDAPPAAALATAPGVERLRVYWDRSLSRRDDLIAREIDLLVSHVARARVRTIDLVTFASDAPQVQSLSDPAALRQALERVTYRGGTTLAGLGGLALADADQCLLFTDGLPTVETEADFAPDCRTTVIASAAEADGARLGTLAQRLRGQFLRLTETNADVLAGALAQPPVSVVAVRDDAGGRLPFRMLRTGRDQWLLVGRLPEQGDIHLRISGLRKGLVEQVVRPADMAAIDHDAAAVLWARQEIGALGQSPQTRERMTRLAQTYQIAGAGMAFLVLERPQQYLDADVRPPADFPAEWQKDYRSLRADHERARAEQRDARFAFVLDQWNQRKAWWNTRFVAKPRRKVDIRAGGRDVALAAPAMVEAPPPQAPARMMAPPAEGAIIPPAPAPVTEAAEEDVANIVVTGTRVAAPAQAVPLAVTTVSARDAAGKAIALDLADVLSNQPYLAALKAAAPGQRLAVLADQEKTYGGLPAFYLETAEWFRMVGDQATARELLYSALELPTTDDETRQVVAFRLERDGALDRAIAMFERIAASTSFRPQPARDLALALAERGRQRGAAGRADLERAFSLLTGIVLDPAIRDFDGIETVALMEANALIPALEAAGGEWTLDPRLVARLDTDLRIDIEWTNDDADIDLWVTEPNGERVYYGYQQSTAGGTITNDMTDGYGPEEYAIRRAPVGDYVVRINGFDADRINPNGNGRVLVRMIRDYGRPTQRETLLDADVGFEKGADRDAGGGKLLGKLTVAAGPPR